MRDLSAESTFDLNLAPMMDMLVSIIPFMLLSATFLQMMLINVPLPEPVAKALAPLVDQVVGQLKSWSGEAA